LTKPTLRFGIMTLQDRLWSAEVERWQRIEALGFDSIWLADHFYPPWLEAWTLLAALATTTTRVRMGTLVTAIAFRHPAMLAKQIVTVDHISNGRLEIGIGAGAPGARDTSYGMLGLADWPPSERVARFREVVEILDFLLRGETTTYPGKYYPLNEAKLQPHPVQKPRPPIVVAALGAKMLEIAARYADVWNSYGGRNMPDEEMMASLRRQNEQLDAYCAKIGRDPQTLRRSALIYGQAGRQVFQSVDIFEEIIGRYREVGFTEFVCYYPFTETELPVFERVAAEVIPRLRQE